MFDGGIRMIILFGKRLKQLEELKKTQSQLVTAMIVRCTEEPPSEEATTKILMGQKDLIEKMFIVLGM